MRSRKRREVQELNTSSLPDIIFMILFFFMAVGQFPSPQAQVENDLLEYSTGEELDETNRYIHVRIGPDGMQLGYELTSMATFKDDLKEFMTENPKRDIAVLHIDDDVAIGLIKVEVEPAILEMGIKNIRYEILEDEKEI